MTDTIIHDCGQWSMINQIVSRVKSFNIEAIVTQRE